MTCVCLLVDWLAGMMIRFCSLIGKREKSSFSEEERCSPESGQDHLIGFY